jgi:23S rRNA pseudouridine2605 synthase
VKPRAGAARGVPLARALSKLGLATRSEARELIEQRRVRVDGRLPPNPAMLVVPEKIRITIDGTHQTLPAAITVALHKPRGVVTTRRDPQGRPTVYGLISDLDARVVPVGRLDVATSGLLLLTNDTRLAEWLTNPDNEVPRVYVVTVRGGVTAEEVERLQRGVIHNDERLVARAVEIRKSSTRESLLIVELVEGRNREIRRMMQVIGHDVTRLRRVQFGGLSIEGLPPGRWRTISHAELRRAFPNARFGYLRPDRTAVK